MWQRVRFRVEDLRARDTSHRHIGGARNALADQDAAAIPRRDQEGLGRGSEALLA
ncbi:hypothetical protein [Actinomadura rudentiformis]|uniref:hypothetical protein n=1 Tax=Actinomadura rudentiformis TaxID=359158 RepID=UPI001CEF680D|nr:hypothetical protein [Actinomadura rudentiformis]